MMNGNRRFFNNIDLEVISQLLLGDFCCGKELEEVGEFFVTRRLKESNECSDPFVVNSVRDVPGKVVLVVAEPGMGKSTLITHLTKSAKAEEPTAWIVHIKLNDCAQYLKVMDLEHFNETEAKKFLGQCALSPGNCLEKVLFSCMEHKLVVFVDGVDEVCPHYEQQAFKLLSFFKDMELRQLWVASRPVCQTKLEELLKVKTLQLVAFSEEDQKEFFNKVWMARVPLTTPEKCIEMTVSLMTWLTNSLGKDNPILGIPLMTTMIAETFQESMFTVHGTCSEFKKNERLDVLNLYKSFVRKKFDVYYVEKKKILSRELAANKSDEENLRKRIHHNHRLAALRVLFSSEEIASLQFEGKDKFDEDLSTYLKEVSEGREKVGIIDNVIEGNPHFVHRSFAEYFAATWLFLNYQSNPGLVERIIFDPAYALVSGMFHRSLAESHSLHIAVLNRDVDEMESILRAQAPLDVNQLDAGGRTPLHLAVLLSATDRHQNVTRILEYLIQKHRARRDIADYVLGWGALRYAEWSGAWMALEIMLVNKENIKRCMKNFKDCPKPTPRLMLDAARDASMSVVRYLSKERGGKLRWRGLRGETMIHRAAEGGNIATLKYLTRKGLPIGLQDNEKNTALRYASPKTVNYLLERGLDPVVINKQGLTAFQATAQNGEYERMAAFLEVKPLHKLGLSAGVSKAQLNASLLCAAFVGKLTLVQKYVAKGATDVHRDSNGHTAAWIALHKGHIEVMDWLILHGCKVGDTTLHAACRKNELDIVSYILSPVPDFGANKWQGHMPLVAAIQGNQCENTVPLEGKGNIVESRDGKGQTPLHIASFCGHKQIVTLLLRLGADVHATDNEGETPLHCASTTNNLDVVELLLEKGASVHCRDASGRTPLHKASFHGHEQIVSMLLSNGADVLATDNKGRTPLLTAKVHGHRDLVKLLKAAAAEAASHPKLDAISTALLTVLYVIRPLHPELSTADLPHLDLSGLKED